MPLFNESKDNIDSYLRRFERACSGMENWNVCYELKALLKDYRFDLYVLLPYESAWPWDY